MELNPKAKRIEQMNKINTDIKDPKNINQTNERRSSKEKIHWDQKRKEKKGERGGGKLKRKHEEMETLTKGNAKKGGSDKRANRLVEKRVNIASENEKDFRIHQRRQVKSAGIFRNDS